MNVDARANSYSWKPSRTIAALAVCLIFLFSSFAFAVEIPRFLYHWTSYENLAAIAGEKQFTERWDSFPAKRESHFSGVFRGTGPNRLFTWTNPVTGMMAQYNEKYGDALVEIEIQVDPKRIGTDLIFYKNGNYQEWVIVNPEIIMNVTADPAVLRPTLDSLVQKIQDPEYLFPDSELHSKVFNDKNMSQRLSARKYATSIAKNFLSHRDLIPSYFLKDRNGQKTYSEWKTGKQTLPAILTWRNNPDLVGEGFRKNLYPDKMREFVEIFHDRAAGSLSEPYGTVADALREVEYRLNVSTEFQEQNRLKNIISEVKGNLSYFATIGQHHKIHELRLKWLNEGLSTADFLRQIIFYAASESHELLREEKFMKSIEAMKLFEQEMRQKMKWTVAGKRIAGALKCSEIFTGPSAR